MTEAELKKLGEMKEKVVNRVREYLAVCLKNIRSPYISDKPTTKKALAREKKYGSWARGLKEYEQRFKEGFIWVLSVEFDIPESVIADFNWTLDDSSDIFELVRSFYEENDRTLAQEDNLFDIIVPLVVNNIVNDLAIKGMKLKTTRSGAYLKWCS